jgi:hypothetical protein
MKKLSFINYTTLRIIVFFALFFFLVGEIFCQIFPDPGSPGTFKEKKKEMKEGDQYASSSPLALRTQHTNRRYQFKLSFWNECWYEPSVGCGWNKVGRISYGNGAFNHNWHKLHVGWRAGNEVNTIRLSAYFHDCNSETQFFSQEIKTIQTDVKAYIDMFLGEHIIALIIDNTAFGARQKYYFPPPKWSLIQRTFYFGGNCTAPHDMAVLFSNQIHDHTDFEYYFNTREIMIWNASRFESGDIATFYSFGLTMGSAPMNLVQSTLTCYPAQMCIIERGADITFESGGSIKLYPGFHAKPGSNFKARIVQKAKNDSLTYIPQIANLPPLDDYLNNADYTDDITLDYESVSIGPGLDKRLDFIIYPNPTSGIFNIEAEGSLSSGYALEVINMMGNTVFSETNVYKTMSQIDISAFPKGIYFIKLSCGESMHTEKIVYR